MSAEVLAYVWPALMVATVLATFAGVGVSALLSVRCDAGHTDLGYSAARQDARFDTSTTTGPGQPSPAETEQTI